MPQGFLGTDASIVADVSLVISLLVALLLTAGVALALQRRYEAHRWVQTVAVALNLILVLTVMTGSFFLGVAPGLPRRAPEPYFAIGLIHGLIGLFAAVFGVFVALRGNELVPRALKFSNYKLFMRVAYGAYMLATLAGLWLYWAWYVVGLERAALDPH